MDDKTYVLEIITRHFNDFAVFLRKIPSRRNIEPIHQMRISYRRLNNACNLFKDIIPSVEQKRWKIQTKELIRISGQMRDIDVHLVFLKRFHQKLKKISYKKLLGSLISELEEKRASLQSVLIREITLLKKKKVIDQFRKLLEPLDRKPKPGKRIVIADVGKKKVTKRLLKFLSYESVVLYPEREKELHHMRIAAKHLRYTLEDFGGFYGHKAAKFAKRVREVQKVLGEMHDFDVWIHMLAGMREKYRDDPYIKKMSQSLGHTYRRSRLRTYQRFVKIWRKTVQDNLWDELQQFVS